MTIYKMIQATLIALLVILTSSCALWSKNNSTPNNQTKTVATDFVAALAMLRGHSPRNTTVQFRPPKTAFGQSLVDELRRAGYGMQVIPENDTGPMLVTYEAVSFENTDHQSIAYRVRVGNTEMGREYELRNSNVYPLTSLSVKGVKIASQPLDQKIFERTLSPDSSLRQPTTAGVFEQRAEIPITIGEQALLASTGNDAWQEIPAKPDSPILPNRIIKEASVTIPQSTQAQPLGRTTNMLMLGESNYSRAFEGYKDHRKEILIFPNDSMSMGRKAKLKTLDVLDDYNGATDIVSIVGCSHGKSALNGGNKQLALGRAKRVFEEIRIIGVPEKNIYHEGCWAGVEQKELPARGVILTVKRKTASS